VASSSSPRVSRTAKPNLMDWQPKASEKKPVQLSQFDPAAKPWSSGNKETDKAAVGQIALEIDTLQNLFYADGRRKLLVVLQGTDTAGKDGTVRGVFGLASPLGVHTVGWKAPTEHERAHDYLWRIHQKMPGNGEVMIFNRSHYEDVLVPVVNQWITPKQTAQRYAHINDFERMLTETGTVILKFMLHISFEEQRERLQERLDDPTKHWKFAVGDIQARKQWPDYQKAYGALLAATHTEHAPWTIVPANSKTHRNLMIGTLVRDALAKLDLRYPEGDASLKSLVIE
jgi:PPK2 family polyphosphate:nucleotide phosphotransferase